LEPRLHEVLSRHWSIIMTTKVLNTLKRALDALEASLPRTRASATQRQEIQEARELLEKLEAAVSAKATPRPSAKVPELEYGLPPSAADEPRRETGSTRPGSAPPAHT